MSIPLKLELKSRREFCALACQAASLAAAGTFAASCGGSPTSANSGADAPQLSTLSGSVSGRSISVAVAGTALANVGGAALISASLGAFLAFRSSDAAVTVLTATCTHEACTVSGFESSQFVCPCHGSRYSTAGSVINGPAPSSLRSFAATLTNGTLTFSA